MSLTHIFTTVAVAGLVSLGMVAVPHQMSTPPVPAASATPEPQSPSTEPRRLQFSLTLSAPEDLKVHQGDTVQAGQVLAERTQARSQLLAQKQQLTLSLKRVQGQLILDPAPLRPVPPVLGLPPVSFIEQGAQISAAQLKVTEAQKQVELQQRKLDLLGSMPQSELPEATLPHEQTVLETKQQALQQAQAAVELARSKLQTAKDQRAYQEYQYSLDLARRSEEANQAQLAYSRQLQEVAQQTRDRDFQVAQLQAKVQEIDTQLAQLAIIRSPYNGTIKRIKWTGQTNTALAVELVLAISGTEPTEPNPRPTSPTQSNTSK